MYGSLMMLNNFAKERMTRDRLSDLLYVLPRVAPRLGSRTSSPDLAFAVCLTLKRHGLITCVKPAIPYIARCMSASATAAGKVTNLEVGTGSQADRQPHAVSDSM